MACVVTGKEFQKSVKAMVAIRSQPQRLLSVLSVRKSMPLNSTLSLSIRHVGGSSVRSFCQLLPSSTSSCFQATTASSKTKLRKNRMATTNHINLINNRCCYYDHHRHHDRHYYSTTSAAFKQFPPHTLFPMPALSPTMEVGTIASWQKKEGDSFIAGDVLCSIETDKASVDFEAQDDGVLAKILLQGPNAVDIRIGSPICVVVDDVADVPAFADFTLESVTAATAGSAADTATATPAPPAVASASSSSLVMPSARHLSHSRGLDATSLEGTGKGGRVTKGDVLLALEQGTFMPPLSVAHSKSPAAAVASTEKIAAAVPLPPKVSSSSPSLPAAAPPTVPPLSLASLIVPMEEISSFGSFHDITNSNMRKVIARRLTESKSQVPHYYTSMEVELDQILALRKQLAKDHDVKVSVNDLVIRCSAMALRDVPQVNATYDPKSQSVQVQSSIDISVAVATPSGLITPIVPNTDRLGLQAISVKVKELATRAREGKLLPQEYQGGTFCVTNLGMFGIDEFSAVINPPQAAILAVGGGSRQVVPTPYIDGSGEQTKPTVKTIMTARLSADRRVVDEPTAALFLSAFRRYMNQPELLLL